MFEAEANSFGETQGCDVSTSSRRRLRSKTAPEFAKGYPARALLKISEYRIQMHKLKLAKMKQRAEFKKARTRAIELLAMSAPSGAFAADEQTEFGEIELPHYSHHNSKLQGGSDTIFCRSCGLWSCRAKLRGLAKRCQGLQRGSKSTLRLLQCGVMPGPHARLPPHMKKVFNRLGRRRRS